MHSDQQKRYFYAFSVAREHWSVRTLRERIASKQYERTLPGTGGFPTPVAKSPELCKNSKRNLQSTRLSAI